MTDAVEQHGVTLPRVHPDIKWQIQASLAEHNGDVDIYAISLLEQLKTENPVIHAVIKKAAEKSSEDTQYVLHLGVFIYDLLRRQLEVDELEASFSPG